LITITYLCTINFYLCFIVPGQKLSISIQYTNLLVRVIVMEPIVITTNT